MTISPKMFEIEKIEICHPEEFNKDYDAKKIKKRLIRDIMHNY